MGVVMNSHKKGFSMVEIAVTIVISSVMYVGFLTFFFNVVKADKEKITIAKLDQIEEALGKYLRKNGTLPCPASRLDSLVSSTLGVATDCSITVPLGILNITTPSSPIRIGTVPVRALELDSNTIFDGWNNKFTYAVIADLAISSNSFKTFAATGVGSFIIRDKNSNQMNISNDVSYVILSHGEKGIGSYSINGIQVKACGVTLEAENCNDDYIFTDAKYYATANSSYYDDILRWKTRSRLIKSNNLAIALP
jgi:type II secretory pathway pseudopilin PulG